MRSKSIPKSLTKAVNIQYQISFDDVHAHLYGVTLEIAHPAVDQIVSLPVWLAGSYMVREFSKQLLNLSAQQNNRNVSIEQLNKHSWRIQCHDHAPLTLKYNVHAYDDSVRTAWLDAQRAFFNSTSLCLQVAGQTDQPHAINIVESTHTQRWHVATGLPALKTNARGFGNYLAADYDELVDSPFEIGEFWRGQFTACGVQHEFVVAGAPPSFDGERLLRDTQTICETAIEFWHGKKRSAIPIKRYVFMLNAVHDGYGGLEHRNSTALICQRADLPRRGQNKASDGYNTLLGLISHEYFHTWNVKRLRPVEFAQYDYSQENYTELLWFFEGFTNYYDDRILRKAELIDDKQYLKYVNQAINQVMQTPGRLVQSVAQSSFDAWVKYYRADANTPNLTVNYYTKGSLVAMCLDLSLRQLHQLTLDDVMRGLWKHCKAGPMSEQDLLDVLKELTGRSWSQEIKAWVHGKRDLPLEALLTAQGVQVHHDPSQLAQRLGLRVSHDKGVQVKQVLNGGVAHKAGFAPGDEWLAIEVNAQGWRIHSLDDVLLYAGQAKKVKALISRDRRMLELTLAIPREDECTTWRLSVADGEKVKAWLS
jgi:predicted metalloprotease with PDZ domain